MVNPAVEQDDITEEISTRIANYNNSKNRIMQYGDSINKYAAQYNIDPGFLYGSIANESSGHSGAVSSAGAAGIGQFIPSTARDIAKKAGDNLDQMDDVQVQKWLIENPDRSILYSTIYKKELLDTFGGDEQKAIAGYNAGPDAVRKAVKAYGDNWLSAMPRETRIHVPAVMGVKERYKRDSAPKVDLKALMAGAESLSNIPTAPPVAPPQGNYVMAREAEQGAPYAPVGAAGVSKMPEAIESEKDVFQRAGVAIERVPIIGDLTQGAKAGARGTVRIARDFGMSPAQRKIADETSSALKSGKFYYGPDEVIPSKDFDRGGRLEGIAGIVRGQYGLLTGLTAKELETALDVSKAEYDTYTSLMESPTLQQVDVKRWGGVGGLVQDITRAIGQIGGSVALTAATKNPAPAAINIIGQIGGGTLEELEKKGMQGKEALLLAAINTGIQYPLEKYGVKAVGGALAKTGAKKVVEKVGEKIAGSAAGQATVKYVKTNAGKALKNIIKSSVAEGWTEAVQQIPDDILTDWWVESKGQSLPEKWDSFVAKIPEMAKNAGYAGFVGMVAAGGPVAVGEIMEARSRPINPEVKHVGDPDFGAPPPDDGARGTEAPLVGGGVLLPPPMVGDGTPGTTEPVAPKSFTEDEEAEIQRYVDELNGVMEDSFADMLNTKGGGEDGLQGQTKTEVNAGGNAVIPEVGGSTTTPVVTSDPDEMSEFFPEGFDVIEKEALKVMTEEGAQPPRKSMVAPGFKKGDKVLSAPQIYYDVVTPDGEKATNAIIWDGNFDKLRQSIRETRKRFKMEVMGEQSAIEPGTNDVSVPAMAKQPVGKKAAEAPTREQFVGKKRTELYEDLKVSGHNGWVNDYNAIMDNSGVKSTGLSEETKKILQTRVDRANDKDDVRREYEAQGLEIPTHVDDVVGLMQGYNAGDQESVERAQQEKSFNKPEYDRAIAQFQEDYTLLTKRQKSLLEQVWGDTFENIQSYYEAQANKEEGVGDSPAVATEPTTTGISSVPALDGTPAPSSLPVQSATNEQGQKEVSLDPVVAAIEKRQERVARGTNKVQVKKSHPEQIKKAAERVVNRIKKAIADRSPGDIMQMVQPVNVVGRAAFESVTGVKLTGLYEDTEKQVREWYGDNFDSDMVKDQARKEEEFGYKYSEQQKKAAENALNRNVKVGDTVMTRRNQINSSIYVDHLTEVVSKGGVTVIRNPDTGKSIILKNPYEVDYARKTLGENAAGIEVRKAQEIDYVDNTEVAAPDGRVANQSGVSAEVGKQKKAVVVKEEPSPSEQKPPEETPQKKKSKGQFIVLKDTPTGELQVTKVVDVGEAGIDRKIEEAVADATTKKTEEEQRPSPPPKKEATEKPPAFLEDIGMVEDGSVLVFNDGRASKPLSLKGSYKQKVMAIDKWMLEIAMEELGEDDSYERDIFSAMVPAKMTGSDRAVLNDYLGKITKDIRVEKPSTPKKQEVQKKEAKNAPAEQTSFMGALESVSPGEGSAVEEARPDSDREGAKGKPGSDDGKDNKYGPKRDAVSRSGGAGGKPGAGVDRVKQEESTKKKPEPMAVEKRAVDTGELYLDDANNYILTDNDFADVTPVQRYNATVAAIETLKKIEKENRSATVDEREVMAMFTGWGALSSIVLGSETASTTDADRRRQAKLQDLLTDEEMAAARVATTNSHYTDPAIIRWMWRAVQRLGLDRGMVLEPATGSGFFIGLRPSGGKYGFTGVEMDSLSARMTSKVYPGANIMNSPYEKVSIPMGAFDLVISNVPFLEIAPYDAEYKRMGIPKGMSLHNFYFAKSLYATRPGGLVAFITSRYTMDTVKDRRHIDYITGVADVVMALRLPNNAFKGVANTEVVTDLIILRKRLPGEKPTENTRAFREVAKITLVGDNDAKKDVMINQYYIENPKNVIGEHSLAGSQYGKNEYTVEFKGDVAAKLDEALKRLPEGIVSGAKENTARVELQAQGRMTWSQGNWVVKDNKVYQLDASGKEVAPTVPGVSLMQISNMVAMRDGLRDLLGIINSDRPDSDYYGAIKKLGERYMLHTKQYGALNSPASYRIVASDPDMASVLALESWDRKTKTATKGPILSGKRPVRIAAVDKADTIEDAFIASNVMFGGVNVEYIAGLLGKDSVDVPEMMVKAVLGYYDPGAALRGEGKVFIGREEMLSGNVRRSLKWAKEMAEKEPVGNWGALVTDLEKVQPPRLGVGQFVLEINSPIVRKEDVQQFAKEVYEMRCDVEHTPDTGTWSVALRYKGKAGPNERAVYSEEDGYEMRLDDVLNHALNGTIPSIYLRVDKDKSVRAPHLEEMVREKIEEVKGKWRAWAFENEDRSTFYVDEYNDKINNTAPRVFIHPLNVRGTDTIQLPGMSPDIMLRRHQANAVWRTLQTANALYAHEVGSGKTFTIIASAMELKRTGLRKKSIIVVPNELVAQWDSSVRQIYPGAKYIVSSEDLFLDKARRRAFLNRVAYEDFDMVVMAYSHYESIQTNPALEMEYLAWRISLLEESLKALSDTGGGGTKEQKRIEKKKLAMTARMRELSNVRREKGIPYFDEMGFDQIFVDEADNFKNLEYSTTSRGILGMGNPSGSKRATDMELKTRYIQRIGGGVVFATGTPISNSLVEAYSMMRYLQYNLLDEQNLTNFDEWARTYAEPVVSFEQSVSGGGLVKRTRYSKFREVGALIRQLRMVWDVIDQKYLEDEGILVPGKNLPKTISKVVSVPMTPLQEEYQGHLMEIEESNKGKRLQKGDTPGIVLMRWGSMSANDIRAIHKSLPNEEGSKINRVIKDAAALTKEYPTMGGLIFIDQNIYKDAKKLETAVDIDLYRYVRERLIDSGVEASKIAFIHEFDTKAKRARLTELMDSGKIQVLIGNTQRMGAGLNVQKRLKWLMDVDLGIPRPRDVIQRHGRIVRQGNDNSEVFIITYVTQGSLDSGIWESVDRKHRMITDVLSNRGDNNEYDESDLFGEISIAATISPAMKDVQQARAELKSLEARKKLAIGEYHGALSESRSNRVFVDFLGRKTKEYENLLGAQEEQYKKRGIEFGKYYAYIEGKLYTDRPEANKLITLFASRLKEQKYGVERFEINGTSVKMESLGGDIRTHFVIDGDVSENYAVSRIPSWAQGEAIEFIDAKENIAKLSSMIEEYAEKLADSEKREEAALVARDKILESNEDEVIKERLKAAEVVVDQQLAERRARVEEKKKSGEYGKYDWYALEADRRKKGGDSLLDEDEKEGDSSTAETPATQEPAKSKEVYFGEHRFKSVEEFVERLKGKVLVDRVGDKWEVMKVEHGMVVFEEPMREGEAEGETHGKQLMDLGEAASLYELQKNVQAIYDKLAKEAARKRELEDAAKGLALWREKMKAKDKDLFGYEQEDWTPMQLGLAEKYLNIVKNYENYGRLSAKEHVARRIVEDGYEVTDRDGGGTLHPAGSDVGYNLNTPSLKFARWVMANKLAVKDRLEKWDEAEDEGGGSDAPAFMAKRDIYSDNFKQWFGDWENEPESASKVVDESGKPLVVYHGAPDKSEIMRDGIFKSQYERFGMGKKTGVHWFASDIATARTYQDPRRAYDYQNAEPGIIHAYLTIKNPLVVDAGGKNWREAQRIGKTSDVIEKAMAAGHDGIIIKNVYDTYNTNPGDATKAKRKPLPVTTYAVFSPTQIKSATGNTGAYSPDNPDIRMEIKAWHGSAVQHPGFDHNFIGSGDGKQSYGWGFYFSSLDMLAKMYVKKEGALYEVSLFKDKNEPNLLKWESVVSPALIKQYRAALGERGAGYSEILSSDIEKITVESFYNNAQYELFGRANDRAMSEWLNSVGYDGITWDFGGVTNYVIFSPEDISIESVGGLDVTPPTTITETAAATRDALIKNSKKVVDRYWASDLITESTDPRYTSLIPALEKLTGRRVVFVDVKDAKMAILYGHTFSGLAFPTSANKNLKNTIFISTTADGALTQVAFHEWTHLIENDKQLYGELVRLARLTGKGMADLTAQGEAEFFADLIGNVLHGKFGNTQLRAEEVLSSEPLLAELAKTKPSLFRRLINYLLKAWSKAISVFKKSTGKPAPVEAAPVKATPVEAAGPGDSIDTMVTNAIEFRDAVLKAYEKIMENISSKELVEIAGEISDAYAAQTNDVPSYLKKSYSRFDKNWADAKKEAESQLDAAREKQTMIGRLRGKTLSLSSEDVDVRVDIERRIMALRGEITPAVQIAIKEYAARMKVDRIPLNAIHGMIDKAKTAGDLRKAIKYVDDMVHKVRYNEVLKDLTTTVVKEYERLRAVETGRLKSTIPLEANNALKVYLDGLVPDDLAELMGIRQPNEKLKDAINKTLAFFHNNPQYRRTTDPDPLTDEDMSWFEQPRERVPEKLLQKIKELYWPKLMTMSIDDMLRVMSDIESIKDTGRTIMAQKREDRRTELGMMAASLVGADTDNPSESAIRQLSKLPDVVESSKKSRSGYLGGVLANGVWSFRDPAGLISGFLGRDKKALGVNLLLEPIWEAEKRKFALVENYTKRFWHIHKDIDMANADRYKVWFPLREKMKGLVAQYNRKLADAADGVVSEEEMAWIERTGKDLKAFMVGKDKKIDWEKVPENLELSYDNLMFIYANSLNEGNRRHLNGSFASEALASEAVAFARENLPSEHIQAVDDMVAWYDEELYINMSSVFDYLNEVALPKEEYYFPIMKLATSMGESVIVADFMARHGAGVGVFKGNTISRVFSKAPFKEMSYFKTVVKSLNMNAHYVAFEKPLREVVSILRQADVKEEAELKNKAAYNEYMDYLRAVGTGKISDDGGDIIDKVADFFRSNFATFALGLKASTAMIQVSSLPKVAAFMSDKSLLITTAEAFVVHPVNMINWVKEQSVFMRIRASSYERELAEAAERSMTSGMLKKKELSKTVKTIALAHIGAIDQAVATVGWVAVYDDAKANGMPHDEAVRFADNVIRKTQSTGGVVTLPGIYRGSGKLRAMMIFTNDLSKNINMLWDMIEEWNLTKHKDKAVMAFWLFVMPALIVHMVRNLMRWDSPEELAKVGVSQFSGGLPLVGPMIDAGVGLSADITKEWRGVIPDRKWTNYVADNGISTLGFMDDIAEGVARGNFAKAAGGVAEGAGLPVTTGRQLFDVAADVATGNYGSIVPDLLLTKGAQKEESVFSGMYDRIYKKHGNKTDQRRYEFSRWYEQQSEEAKNAFRKYAAERNVRDAKKKEKEEWKKNILK